MWLKKFFNLGTSLNKANINTRSKTTDKIPETIENNYKNVILQETPNKINFFKWFNSFTLDANKELRIIAHNLNKMNNNGIRLGYSIENSPNGWFSIYPDGYKEALCYLKSGNIMNFAHLRGIPLLENGELDQNKIDLDILNFNERKHSEFLSDTNLSSYIDIDGQNTLDEVNNLLHKLHYDMTIIPEIILEFIKYDYCMAMYHRFALNKTDYHQLNMPSFFENFSFNFDDLIVKFGDSYSYRMDYEKLASIAYALYINNDTIQFTSLEDLFFIIKEKYHESQLLKYSNYEDFSDFEPEFNPEYNSNPVKHEYTSVSDRIDIVDPFRLEELVEEAFIKLGYEGSATKKTGDQGADVVVTNPKINEKIVVQIKQYNSKVSNKAVQEVLAAKAYYNADRSIVMTTDYFTKSAIELANQTNVELFDREKFIDFLDKAEFSE